MFFELYSILDCALYHSMNSVASITPAATQNEMVSINMETTLKKIGKAQYIESIKAIPANRFGLQFISCFATILTNKNDTMSTAYIKNRCRCRLWSEEYWSNGTIGPINISAIHALNIAKPNRSIVDLCEIKINPSRNAWLSAKIGQNNILIYGLAPKEAPI